VPTCACSHPLASAVVVLCPHAPAHTHQQVHPLTKKHPSPVTKERREKTAWAMKALLQACSQGRGGGERVARPASLLAPRVHHARSSPDLFNVESRLFTNTHRPCLPSHAPRPFCIIQQLFIAYELYPPGPDNEYRKKPLRDAMQLVCGIGQGAGGMGAPAGLGRAAKAGGWACKRPL